MHTPAYLEANGSRIEYFARGTGSPVVLLHSTASSSAQWLALTEQLCARHRVVALNLLGYGNSSNWDGRGPFRLQHETAPLDALVRELGQPAHLIGHSYGGAVALAFARTRPHLVRSLALYEPVAFHLLRGGDARDRTALAEIRRIAANVRGALRTGHYAAGARHFVDYWSGPGTWAMMPPGRRQAVVARLPKVALDFHATLHEPAVLSDFAALRMPRMLLRGARTTVPAQRICDALGKVWSDARQLRLEGAGHMAPLTHAPLVNALLAGFLEEQAPPAYAARSPEERRIPA